MAIIGLSIVFFTFVLWGLILFKDYTPKVNEAIVLGALSSLASTVINYYFGSSLSSAKKEDALNRR